MTFVWTASALTFLQKQEFPEVKKLLTDLDHLYDSVVHEERILINKFDNGFGFLMSQL